MTEPTEVSAARYERDIGELHGAISDLRQSVDGNTRELGELRSEQRRQANMLDELRGEVSEVRGTLDQHGQQLTEIQSLLEHITRRLDQR
jgi:chromosome segregation ATPase